MRESAEGADLVWHPNPILRWPSPLLNRLQQSRKTPCDLTRPGQSARADGVLHCQPVCDWMIAFQRPPRQPGRPLITLIHNCWAKANLTCALAEVDREAAVLGAPVTSPEMHDALALATPPWRRAPLRPRPRGAKSGYLRAPEGELDYRQPCRQLLPWASAAGWARPSTEPGRFKGA